MYFLDSRGSTGNEADQQYQRPYKNRRTDDAGNDQLQRRDTGKVGFIIGSPAHTEKRPEYCLENPQR